jgi:hypothetical protein
VAGAMKRSTLQDLTSSFMHSRITR